MSHVHLDVFFDYLIECALRHVVDRLKGCRKIHHGRKAKIALGNVDRAHLPGKIVHVLEKMAMDGAQPRKRARLERIEQPGFEELSRAQLRQALLFARKLDLVYDSQLVLKHRCIPS